MNERRWNWPLWTGFVLSVAAFFSYFFFFSRFPITRDIPWVNVLLFAVAMALLVAGVRRARRKILAGIVAAVGAAVFVFFGFAVLVATKQIPASPGAPRVGQKAPDFAMVDTGGKTVTLSQLLSSSPRGVLLVFYRGFW
jgi:hypothetical protein